MQSEFALPVYEARVDAHHDSDTVAFVTGRCHSEAARESYITDAIALLRSHAGSTDITVERTTLAFVRPEAKV